MPTSTKRADLDAQYDLRLRHPDFQLFFDRNDRASARVRKALPCRTDVAYGRQPGEKLDIFPAPRPKAPVQFFIHQAAAFVTALSRVDYPCAHFVLPGLNHYTIAQELGNSRSALMRAVLAQMGQL